MGEEEIKTSEEEAEAVEEDVKAGVAEAKTDQEAQTGEEEQESATSKNTVTIEEAGPCKKKVIIEIPEETIRAATSILLYLPRSAIGRQPARNVPTLRPFGLCPSDQPGPRCHSQPARLLSPKRSATTRTVPRRLTHSWLWFRGVRLNLLYLLVPPSTMHGTVSHVTSRRRKLPMVTVEILAVHWIWVCRVSVCFERNRLQPVAYSPLVFCPFEHVLDIGQFSSSVEIFPGFTVYQNQPVWSPFLVVGLLVLNPRVILLGLQVESRNLPTPPL